VCNGIRVTLTATLGTARIPLQVDVGFGDAITPGPLELDFPTFLDRPPPRLLAYPPEAVVAERLEALVTLGMDNSRMKDFHDLWFLSRTREFDGPLLSGVTAATFARRHIAVPEDPPVAFTPLFASDTAKQAQWTAFVKRQLVAGDTPPLSTVMDAIAAFLTPVLRSVCPGEPLTAHWPAGGPWG
jgi:hypothetical protein